MHLDLAAEDVAAARDRAAAAGAVVETAAFGRIAPTADPFRPWISPDPAHGSGYGEIA